MDINLKKLIYPLFVKKGKGVKEEIPLMPGVYRMSPDVLVKEVEYLFKLGIRNFLLFGVPEEKTWGGDNAYSRNNAVTEAVRLIKSEIPHVNIFTDVCLCAYTSHGHCGIVKEGKEEIDIEETLKILSKIAVVHADAGADYVAPSAMARGQVKAIRRALDVNGHKNKKIMAYSAKFNSNAYGPFRNIAESSPKFGDRGGYQLDYTDKKAALRRIDEEITEGADIVMVKPALWYLDIVAEAAEKFNRPVAVYNVSGEYTMVKEGVKAGLFEEKNIIQEIFSSFERAGADLIISYHAKEVAEWRNEETIK